MRKDGVWGVSGDWVKCEAGEGVAFDGEWVRKEKWVEG